MEDASWAVRAFDLVDKNGLTRLTSPGCEERRVDRSSVSSKGAVSMTDMQRSRTFVHDA